MIDCHPIVVAGSGGSGTRAVAQYCSVRSVYMGRDLSDAWDATAFVPALSEIIDPILSETGRLDYSLDELSERTREHAIKVFERAVKAHLTDRPPNSLWGFKNPRQIFVLPVVAALFPEAKFVHVVRDGRDMMLSANQN